jgi:23S rRNA (uracil1939-C5)-methyltransferase
MARGMTGDRSLVGVSERVIIHDLAVGGDGVGRLEDGRVVFVPGAALDDELRIELTEEKDRFARGSLVEVLTPGPGRREPPCPHVARGCGGCDWQHLDDDAQADGKMALVEAALSRLGGVEVPEVRYVAGPEPLHYRTTVRVGVLDGRAAYRARGANDLVRVEDCLVAHPLMDDILAEGWFADAEDVTIRVGARTGDRLVMGEPRADGFKVPEPAVVVGRNRARKGAEAFVVEEAAGVEWRISARSFFQSSPEGAEMLVALAAEWLELNDVGEVAMVDLYAGVGLFSGTVGDWFDKVTAIESSASAVSDAEHNLAPHVTIIRSAVEEWTPELADVVIADPPRAGLRAAGVEVIARTEAPHLLLVSCDAGALGRDAGLLHRSGYRLDQVDVLDMFPQTSHVEVVTGWIREA